MVRLERAGAGPLYRQIADRLAYGIATGRLRPGERLPSLRQAQDAWGVNLHTVRHAYRELQSRGLVQVRERGETIVLGAETPHPPETLRDFLAAALVEAQRRFGAAPGEVAATMRDLAEARPAVAVVECSHTLAESIASQITAAWQVEATPYLLSDAWPDDQLVLSTYFHFSQLRDWRWRRAGGVHFLRIHLSTRLLNDVATQVARGTVGHILLCETDASLALDLAAELRATVGPRPSIAIHTPKTAWVFLANADQDALKLISPRHWDRLPWDQSRDPRVRPLEYEVEPADLAALGRARGWRSRDRSATDDGTVTAS